VTQRHTEIEIQPLVNWPRTVEAGHSYRITVDLRLATPGTWPYDEEELVIGCTIDGRPICRVLALGDAGVVLHRFGGSYGPAQFLAEVPEDQTDFADAALWLTLTTAGGVPFYTGKLPMDGSSVFPEDDMAERAATGVGRESKSEGGPPTPSSGASDIVPGHTAGRKVAAGGTAKRGASKSTSSRSSPGSRAELDEEILPGEAALELGNTLEISDKRPGSPRSYTMSRSRDGITMRDIIRDRNSDRLLLWIAASNAYVPVALRGWRRIDLAGMETIIPDDATSAAGYSVIFEATCNSMLNFDPVIQAWAVRSQFGRVPDRLVALVAPSLEVPVAAQHAIAYEAGEALGSQRVDVVTIAEHWSPQSDRKMAKAKGDSNSRSATALDEALDIVAGKKRGEKVNEAAVAFAYAYTSRAGRRTPFRCTPLQRRILSVVASGAITPTTSAISDAVYASEKKVNESIADLVDALVPRAGGRPEMRDSRERLYWLMHHYGVWIRLVDGRSRNGGINPSMP
jgi:hypothetical protein